MFQRCVETTLDFCYQSYIVLNIPSGFFPDVLTWNRIIIVGGGSIHRPSYEVTVRLITTRQNGRLLLQHQHPDLDSQKTTSVMSTISGIVDGFLPHRIQQWAVTSTKVIVAVTTMSMFGNTSTSKLVPMPGTTGTGTPGTTLFCFSFSLPVSTQLTSRNLAGIDGTAIGKIESSSGYHVVAGPKHPKYPCGKASCLNHLLNLLNCRRWWFCGCGPGTTVATEWWRWSL